MIHRDDLVRAVDAAIRRGKGGEIYNVADDEPVREVAFFSWLAETLGGTLPPRAEEEVVARRKRGLTDKRISNRRLKEELACSLRYPTYRQGYAAEMDRLRREGLLPASP
jgi:nucleoside-diphosphate-sugar epimerase